MFLNFLIVFVAGLGTAIFLLMALTLPFQFDPAWEVFAALCSGVLSGMGVTLYVVWRGHV